MIKQHISWKSPSGKPMNRTLHFHLDEWEVTHDMELEVIQERLKRFQDDVIKDGELVRELSEPEKREMLDIVQVLIKHSYGIREMGPDGEEFNKDEPAGSGDIWRRFKATGAFNAFVLYLFEDPQRANYFMANIWPDEIREAYAKEQNERPDIHLVEDDEEIIVAPSIAPDDDIPSIESAPVAASQPEPRKGKEWFEYDKQELLDMPRDKFETIFAEGRKGKNVPPQLLNIRQQRKLAEGAEPGGTAE